MKDWLWLKVQPLRCVQCGTFLVQVGLVRTPKDVIGFIFKQRVASHYVLLSLRWLHSIILSCQLVLMICSLSSCAHTNIRMSPAQLSHISTWHTHTHMYVCTQACTQFYFFFFFDSWSVEGNTGLVPQRDLFFKPHHLCACHVLTAIAVIDRIECVFFFLLVCFGFFKPGSNLVYERRRRSWRTRLLQKERQKKKENVSVNKF